TFIAPGLSSARLPPGPPTRLRPPLLHSPLEMSLPILPSGMLRLPPGRGERTTPSSCRSHSPRPAQMAAFPVLPRRRLWWTPCETQGLTLRLIHSTTTSEKVACSRSSFCVNQPCHRRTGRQD